MPWYENVWKDYVSPVVDTSLGFTAYSVEIMSYLVSSVGGIAYSMSFVSKESLHAAYYGQTTLEGTVALDLTIKDLFHFNDSLPYDFSGQDTGGVLSKLEQYIGSYKLSDIALIFWATSVSMNVIASNIKAFQQNRRDALLIEATTGKPVQTYNRSTYTLVTLKAASLSTAITCYGALAGSVAAERWLQGDGPKGLTYPSHSDALLETNAYSGPVDTISIPIERVLTHNQTIKLPIFPLPMMLNQVAHIKGLLNFTYGGGVALKPTASLTPAIAAVSFTALVTSAASFFAHNKIDKTTKIRLIKGKDESQQSELTEHGSMQQPLSANEQSSPSAV